VISLIKDLFVKYGAVEKSGVDVDNKGNSLESATVKYRDPLSAQRAIEELHRAELDGRLISVEFLKTNRERGGGGGGFRSQRRERSLPPPPMRRRGLFKNNRREFRRGGGNGGRGGNGGGRRNFRRRG